MKENKQLLDLKENQIIIIENIKYEVLNKIKFVEKSSYWIEYKLRNIDNLAIYYLNVELSGKVILYKILNNFETEIKTKILFEGKQFEIYECGKGYIETYFGLTDIALNEQVRYYEYNSNEDKSKILSIEKWKDEIEISIGNIINTNEIKISK